MAWEACSGLSAERCAFFTGYGEVGAFKVPPLVESVSSILFGLVAGKLRNSVHTHGDVARHGRVVARSERRCNSHRGGTRGFSPLNIQQIRKHCLHIFDWVGLSNRFFAW